MNDPNVKTLYHFTSKQMSGACMAHGLFYGSVALTPSTGFNAVWLTEDSDPDEQVWAKGAYTGRAEVCIEVRIVGRLAKVPLIRWLTLAEVLHVTNWWHIELDRIGGDQSKWWLYLGRIPPEWFGPVLTY